MGHCRNDFSEASENASVFTFSPVINFLAFLLCFLLLVAPAHAVLDLKYQKDKGPIDDCKQSWPVDCEANNAGGAGCGNWRIIKNLAESESMPGTPGNSCSTGVRLALPDSKQTQGQQVGAMFPGKVIFAQSGKARYSGNGKIGIDYGGTVVIELELDDGSPKCFLRYMFLDRRDLVKVGTQVSAGQRIGSIASDDMSATRKWWSENWPGMEPNVKIDIGCDEALANMPHFMPYEAYSGGGPQDPNSCPLTKMRFPAPVLTYLSNTDFGKKRDATGQNLCRVGRSGNDARPEFKPAAKQDMQENNAKYDGNYIKDGTPHPRGLIKRKKTPVYALFEEPDVREDLYGTNRNRNSSPVFRENKNYVRSTALSCANMAEIFHGKDGQSVTPERARELLNHCTNQFIILRGHTPQIHEAPDFVKFARSTLKGKDSLIKDYQLERLTPEDNQKYAAALAMALLTKRDIGTLYSQAQDVIAKVEWINECQPLAMQPVQFNDYKVDELLYKAWQEQLIEWPAKHQLTAIPRTQAIPTTPINDFVKYPYERINDPSNPFSPRHIFAETERERYSDYNVQCAATPVDIILGSYPRTEADQSAEKQQTYGPRDKNFHGCVKCRIEINETKQACFADPYSFTNLGGCFQSLTADMGKNLCSSFKLEPYATDPRTGKPASTQDFLNYLYELEEKNGLTKGLLHAIATQESSCVANIANGIGAKGMFQWLDNVNWNPMDPWVAAEKTAARYAASAKKFQCKLDHMITEFNCGPGCVLWVIAGTYTLPTETVNYIRSISGMLGGTMNGCSSGGGGSAGGGGSGGPRPGDVFGGGGGNLKGLGSFDYGNCPENYFSSTHKTPPGRNLSFISGDKACPPLSNPVPDNQHQPLSRIGDSNNWWVNWGCTRDFGVDNGPVRLGTRFQNACQWMENQGYNGSKWCPGRTCTIGTNGKLLQIHEGIDHTQVGAIPSLGMPVYAAGSGKVVRVSETSRDLDIDHSGYCIVSGTRGNCDEHGAYPNGVMTSYRHMGARIFPEMKNGTEVKRCQQIGTVGSDDAPASGDLHFELHDPANSITGRNPYSQTYWPYDVNQPFHIHPGDKSCGGGISDAEGALSSRGICKYKLPVNTTDKEDLTPPEYYESYDKLNVPPVPPVAPPSPGHVEKFDLKKKGMVFKGAWRNCDSTASPVLTEADRKYCESLPDKPAEEKENKPPLNGGSTGFANPTPCAPVISPYGTRSCLSGDTVYLGQCWHKGVDFGAPAGTPILAPADGVITNVFYDGCAGNMTYLTHANGLTSVFMHQQDQCGLRNGDTVKQGQVIGHVGATGSCQFGAHLHYGIKDPAQTVLSGYIDPFGEKVNMKASDAGSPQCANLRAAKCGDIVTEFGVGTGGTGGGKRLCVDKPCTVRYEEADTVAQCAWKKDEKGCDSFGDFSQRNGDCCFNLTAPVASMNMLKTRPGFDNEARTPGWTEGNNQGIAEFIPGAWDSQRTVPEGGTVSPSPENRGAPEGYTFYEHFRDHRPYMRWWDTGAESGQVIQEQLIADDNQGRFDSLVGVGIEKQNCGFGGQGGSGPIDGNSSWMELKLYQARTQSKFFHCIGRYEYMYKPNSAEDFVHQLAGGNLNTYLVDALKAREINVPLGWRGYASEPDNKYRFPNYRNINEDDTGKTGVAMINGLDNALAGDIIIWDQDVLADGSLKLSRLPHVAYVIDGNNAAIRRQRKEQIALSKYNFTDPAQKGEILDSLRIVDFDHGRYPDACGTTNWAGVGVDRIIYKTRVPKPIQDSLTNYGIKNANCGNSDLANCYENLWDRVKVFRPWKYVRD